jgi:hypothetical protein
MVKLTKKQNKAINWFLENPPDYYRWFYRFFKNVLSYAVFFLIIAAFLLAIINTDLFIVIRGIFFIVFTLGLWALSAFLYKHFYTKRYAKKIGLTLKEWNIATKGMTWDI